MVFQEARRCIGPSRGWIFARRRHLPHHDNSFASRVGVWLDAAYLCFHDIGTAHFRKFNRSFKDSPNEAPIQPTCFRASSEGAEFRAIDRGSLLLLL